jgi:hypothetical protein
MAGAVRGIAEALIFALKIQEKKIAARTSIVPSYRCDEETSRGLDI